MAGLSMKHAHLFAVSRYNRGNNGATVVSRARSPPTYPPQPKQTYAKTGWTGIGDWLGRTTLLRRYRSFKDARTFVRRLELESRDEWNEYCQSAKSQVIFHLIPIRLTRRLVRLEWAIRSVRGRLLRTYVNIDHSKMLALSCAASA